MYSQPRLNLSSQHQSSKFFTPYINPSCALRLHVTLLRQHIFEEWSIYIDQLQD
ncbi:hypothetical protein [Candidatus Liberibacter solanacearum]|uniref:hypothetical protein n=1 Tax=Candidatus Liberibacter solanacearum TaxID=556287 RepID=UPI001FCAB254|nr:hypothetical protein [Candidatus Liberibacter solanacearum]